MQCSGPPGPQSSDRRLPNGPAIVTETKKIEDAWFLAEGELEGLPAVIRARQHLTDWVGHPDYSRKLTIAWSYRPVDESGMPSDTTYKQMDAFEDALFEALERGPSTIFVAVYTHNGRREWIGYTRDIDESESLMTRALEEHEHYPLELSTEEDPQWAEYLTLLQRSGHEET
jgi:hypothetical protein